MEPLHHHHRPLLRGVLPLTTPVLGAATTQPAQPQHPPQWLAHPHPHLLGAQHTLRHAFHLAQKKKNPRPAMTLHRHLPLLQQPQLRPQPQPLLTPTAASVSDPRHRSRAVPNPSVALVPPYVSRTINLAPAPLTPTAPRWPCPICYFSGYSACILLLRALRPRSSHL